MSNERDTYTTPSIHATSCTRTTTQTVPLNENVSTYDGLSTTTEPNDEDERKQIEEQLKRKRAEEKKKVLDDLKTTNAQLRKYPVTLMRLARQQQEMRRDELRTLLAEMGASSNEIAACDAPPDAKAPCNTVEVSYAKSQTDAGPVVEQLNKRKDRKNPMLACFR